MSSRSGGSGAVRGGSRCSPSGNNSAKGKTNDNNVSEAEIIGNARDIKTQKEIDLDSDHGLSKKNIYQLLFRNTHTIANDHKRLRGMIEDGLPLVAVNEIDENWGDIPYFDRTPRVKDLNDHLHDLFNELADKEITEWFSDISSKKDGHAISRMINLMARQHGLEYKDGNFLEELKDIFQYETFSTKTFVHLLFGDVRFIHTYEDLITEFLGYLTRTENTTVAIGNLVGEKNLSFLASHRWDENYSKKMMAKVKDLEESRFNSMPVAVLRLSGYQDGDLKPEDFNKDRERSWFELNDDLDDGRKKLLSKLRKVSKRQMDDVKLHFFWVREPHPSSGYPHIHLVVFGKVAHWLRKSSNQEHITNLWSKKWDIGNEHGLHFDCDIPERSGKGALESVANYLLKYLVKSFGDVDSKHQDTNIMDMSYEELLYNAGLWCSGSRSWSASKEVSKAMSNDEKSESKGVFVFGGGTFNKSPDELDIETVVSMSDDEDIKDTFELRKSLKPKIEERYKDYDEWGDCYANS